MLYWEQEHGVIHVVIPDPEEGMGGEGKGREETIQYTGYLFGADVECYNIASFLFFSFFSFFLSWLWNPDFFFLPLLDMLFVRPEPAAIDRWLQ